MAVRDVKELTETHTGLILLNAEVGKMLRSMHENPQKFLTRTPSSLSDFG